MSTITSVRYEVIHRLERRATTETSGPVRYEASHCLERRAVNQETLLTSEHRAFLIQDNQQYAVL